MLRSAMLGVLVACFSAANCWAGLILTGTVYSEDFNGGLPSNWTVRTGATATVLGTSVALGSGTWGTATGQFFSSASAKLLLSNTSAVTQNAATDRALSVRQTGGFGDPGAAFVLEIENTNGFNSFSMSLNAELQSDQERTTTWRIDYGFGASPALFTSIGNVNLGTTFGVTANALSFGSALDNRAGPVWIRIATLSNSSGQNSRDTFAIDDISLNYSITAVPEPSSMALLGLAGCVGLAASYGRRKLKKFND
jgi:hypothetical protein